MCASADEVRAAETRRQSQRSSAPALFGAQNKGVLGLLPGNGKRVIYLGSLKTYTHIWSFRFRPSSSCHYHTDSIAHRNCDVSHAAARTDASASRAFSHTTHCCKNCDMFSSNRLQVSLFAVPRRARPHPPARQTRHRAPPCGQLYRCTQLRPPIVSPPQKAQLLHLCKKLLIQQSTLRRLPCGLGFLHGRGCTQGAIGHRAPRNWFLPILLLIIIGGLLRRRSGRCEGGGRSWHRSCTRRA